MLHSEKENNWHQEEEKKKNQIVGEADEQLLFFLFLNLLKRFHKISHCPSEEPGAERKH